MHFKSWLESEVVIPKGNLNIPRNEMPQVQASDVPDFLEFLEKKGIKHKKENVHAGDLKATQKEIDLDKVKKLKDEKIENLKKPLIVSSDSHIMDGHHRWLALLAKDMKCPCYIVDTPMKKLIELGKKFPKSFKKNI